MIDPKSEWCFRIQKSYTRDNIGVWIMYRNYATNKNAVAKPTELVFEDVEDGFFLPEPTLSFPKEAIPALAHGLMDAEYLPREFLKNDAEIKAIREHQTDLKIMNERFYSIVMQRGRE